MNLIPLVGPGRFGIGMPDPVMLAIVSDPALGQLPAPITVQAIEMHVSPDEGVSRNSAFVTPDGPLLLTVTA